MRSSRPVLLVVVLTGTLLGFASVMPLRDLRAEEAPGQVLMNFQDVEIEAFIQWLSTLTGKRFLYDDSGEPFAKKRINFISPEPVEETRVLAVARSVLEIYGIALVESGEGKATLFKVVETRSLAGQPTPIITPEELSNVGREDQYLTLHVRLAHLKSRAVLSSLLQSGVTSGPAARLVEVAETNSLLISDFAPNVQRIYSLVRQMDTPPPEIVTEIVPVRNARLAEVANQLTQIQQARTSRLKDYQVGDQVPTVIADARTGSLVIQGAPAAVAETRRIIEGLDREVPSVTPTLEIYRLQNAKAVEIVPVLREILSKPPFALPEGQPVQPGQPGSLPVQLMTDEAKGTLFVTATESVHQEIRKLLKTLDARPAQVLIETAIVELTAADTLELGIELLSLDSVSDTPNQSLRGKGLTQFGLSSLVDEVGDPVSEDSPGIPGSRLPSLGAGLSAFLVKGDNARIPILLRTLERVAETRILSSPRLLTNDKEPAEIAITEEFPVAQLNILNNTVSSTSFQSFVPAGTSMRIEPAISEGGHVRLAITLSLDSFLGTAPTPNLPPAKTTRKLMTNVTVPDGSTIILGGFTARREIETEEKVPILGDIPLLGLLFRNTASATQKSHIYVFMTPRILTAEDFSDLRERSRIEEERARDQAGHAPEGSKEGEE